MTMTNQSDEPVLDELARAIAQKGSRADFAREVGIGQVYLSQILCGKRPLGRLPLDTVKRIAAASGVSLLRIADISAAPLAPGGGE
jgi:transcriptional regulator with XRE-family HTH domain